MRRFTHTLDATVSVVAQNAIRQRRSPLTSKPQLVVSHFSEKVSAGPRVCCEVPGPISWYIKTHRVLLPHDFLGTKAGTSQFSKVASRHVVFISQCVCVSPSCEPFKVTERFLAVVGKRQVKGFTLGDN